MALIIPTGFAQVQLPLSHALSLRSALVTWGIDITDAAGDFVQVADDMPSVFGNAFGSEMASDVTIGPATIRVGQDGGDPLAVEGSATTTASETAAIAPSSVALLVKKASATGGRRGRGRMYIPWIVQDAAVDEVGMIAGASLPTYQGDATAFFNDLAAGTTGDYVTPMVILHDSSGAGPEPSPSVVTGLTVDGMVANQRRRLGR